MKTNLCPDFPLYVGDWLASTKISLMTPAEEGGFIRLLCHAWSDLDCCITEDDTALAQLSRLGTAWNDGSGTRIRACFTSDPTRPGFMFNARQRAERIKQQERVEKSKQQRIDAANARWGKRSKPQSDRNATALPSQSDRNATASDSQCERNASYSSPFSLHSRQSLVDKGDQASARAVVKLKPKQKELADRFESALGGEWLNDAGKWVNRIKSEFDTAESVLFETESAIKESRIKKSPAAFAEDLWGHWFKPSTKN